jgi:hypothetical protein
VGGERDQAGLRRYLDAVTFEESPAPLRGPLEFLLRALQKLDWSADKYGLIGTRSPCSPGCSWRAS